MNVRPAHSRAVPRAVAAAIAAALVAGFPACGGEDHTAAPPPPTVLVGTVEKRDVHLYVEAVGSFDGYVNADIRARVRGYLKSQNYKDGSRVKAGDLLFTIERTEYVARVDAARAAVSQAKVAEELGRIQVERAQGLFNSGVVSRQDLDNAVANAASTQSQVRAAQADLEQANLNLSYTEVRAPIDGMAGIALVRIGNLVGQDTPTLLTTVSEVDPVRVNFPLSETDYVKYPDRFKHFENRDLAWAKRQFARMATVPATEEGEPGLELGLSDGSVYPHRGVIVAANRQIDTNTGTIQLQALVPNPDGVLRPGQFARVRVPRPTEGQGVLVVPEKALVSVQGTYSVAVVKPDDTVDLRRVELGPTAPGIRIVEKGVSEGERIVVEGVQRAKNGAKVAPKPAPAGSASAAPGAPSGAPGAPSATP